MTRVRYTSDRNSKLAKVSTTALTAAGALGLSGIGHSLTRLGHAMSGNPFYDAVVALGLIGMGYSFRDPILGTFGWLVPGRAERLIRKWLDTQRFAHKQDNPPPNFQLTVTDNRNRNYAVLWRKDPFVGLEISTAWGVGADTATVWNTASPADLRELTTQLVELGTRLEGGGVNLENIQDAAMAKVTYVSIIPRDLINYEELFRRFYAIQGCVVIALNHIHNLHETLKDRMADATPPALQPGTP